MYMPYDLFVELTIKQGKLFIDSKEVKGGIRKNQIVVDFIKGKADNPKVNALILVKGTVKNTHQANFQKF